MDLFPRTEVAGISLSRMIIGTNWIYGYSHTSASADKMIRDRNWNTKSSCDLICAFLERGVDTLMGPLNTDHFDLWDAIHMAEDKVGRKIHTVDTPIINVDDNENARREAEAVIKKCAASGSEFCLIHHSSAEQLVNKNLHQMPRLDDYTKMIRDNGMIPGLSAHMPEMLIYSDLNGYDIQTYIQLYNCMGFLMQFEIEYIHKVIHNAKKPVMAIKPMAAGRCSPFVGLTFNYATLRPCDMIVVGCLTPEEAIEDIEISLAAIERRVPDLEGRNSPNKTIVMQQK